MADPPSPLNIETPDRDFLLMEVSSPWLHVSLGDGVTLEGISVYLSWDHAKEIHRWLGSAINNV